MKKALLILLVLFVVGCKKHTPNIPEIEPKIIVSDSIRIDSVVFHRRVYIDGYTYIITREPNAE